MNGGAGRDEESDRRLCKPLMDAADCSAERVSLSQLLGGCERRNVGLCAKLCDLGLTIRDASSQRGTRHRPG